MMTFSAASRTPALRDLIPLRWRVSEWIESDLHLPEGVSALPGRVRLWPYQREIADAISDPEIERITLVRPARTFTTRSSASLRLHRTALCCSAGSRNPWE